MANTRRLGLLAGLGLIALLASGAAKDAPKDVASLTPELVTLSPRASQAMRPPRTAPGVAARGPGHQELDRRLAGRGEGDRAPRTARGAVRSQWSSDGAKTSRRRVPPRRSRAPSGARKATRRAYSWGKVSAARVG